MRKTESTSDPLKQIKDWVLGTGFPMENEVCSLLGKVPIGDGGKKRIERTQSFYAVTEENVEKVRELDVRATFSYPLKNTIPEYNTYANLGDEINLVFLVEAKFTSEGKWWFLPSSATTRKPLHFPYLIPFLERKSEFSVPGRSALNSFQVFRKGLIDVALSPQNCTIASACKREGRDTREDGPHNFQIQVNQGLLAEMEESVLTIGKEQTQESKADVSKDIFIFVPIIVTNATLYEIRNDLTRSSVARAGAESDLCNLTTHVLVERPRFYPLTRQIAKIDSQMGSPRNNKLGWVKQTDILDFPTLFVHIDSMELVVTAIVLNLEAALRRER